MCIDPVSIGAGLASAASAVGSAASAAGGMLGKAVPFASTALNMLGTAQSHGSKRLQARRQAFNAEINFRQQQIQHQAAEQANEFNRIGADLAATLDNAALDTRFLQAWEGVSQQAQQVQRGAEGAISTVAATAADRGLGGNSIKALMDDLAGQAASQQAVLARNLEGIDAQTKAQKLAVNAQRASRVAGIQPAMLPVRQFTPRGPSTASLYLGLGADALQGLRLFNSMNSNTPSE